MKICILVPESPFQSSGEFTTARRWAEVFYALKHEVALGDAGQDVDCDLLVAIDAVACAGDVNRSYRKAPQRPVVLAIVGPDLEALPRNPAAQTAIDLATRIVVFQPATADLLPRTLRRKVQVIFQSAGPTKPRPLPRRDCFPVIVVSHLREHKQPFLIAEAVRLLPTASRIRVEHYGAAFDAQLEEQVRRETLVNGRYHWGGEIGHRDLRKRLASSGLFVNTSRVEGGANALSEAVADHVPVLASRIPGNSGVLGESYPGYFTPNSPADLAVLLARAESDDNFYRRLRDGVAGIARLLTPAAERRQWRSLLAEIQKPSRARKASLNS